MALFLKEISEVLPQRGISSRVLVEEQPRQFAGRSKASVTSAGCPIDRNALPEARLCAAAHSRPTGHAVIPAPSPCAVNLQIVVWHDRRPAL